MLADIHFVDIYLGESGSWLTGVPGTTNPIEAPQDCVEEVKTLHAACVAYHNDHNEEEFRLQHGELLYRVSTMDTVEGIVYVARLIPNAVPDIKTLRLNNNIVSMLMEKDLKGLVIICGAYGEGKTTTASALVKARLEAYGGIAVTIEDPPENKLQGKHGVGQCYQQATEDFAKTCKRNARQTPCLIYMGEIRDPEAAKEALLAGVNGRLIICTLHAADIPTAFERIFTLASTCFSNSDDVSSLLASGISFVLHQRLDGDPKHPKLMHLNLSGTNNVGVKSMIKNKKWTNLNDVLSEQMLALSGYGTGRGN